MKEVGLFYSHVEYITSIGFSLWPFGNLHIGNLVHFPPIWVL
jgi:hypothetical protein